MAASPRVLVGVDTGGTFTDFVAIWPDGSSRILKRPSTPDDPARAVLSGLQELLDGREADVTYGTTVATNAVLERKGARVSLLTTAGFEDLLEIGRQARPDIYALNPRKPEPLVPAARRFGVAERLGFDGAVIEALTTEAIDEAIASVDKARSESVAVCLLHSYADRRHEDALADALRRRGFDCSTSAELIAEYREYERLSTTVMNAYVAPVMRRHLGRLRDGIEASSIRVMQSSGGAVSLETVSREAVRTLLSGPAGGVVGATAAARRVGEDKLITFDMGGTSTDVSLVDGVVRRHTEWAIGELPVKVPSIDIHTVGAGGGSIAYVDAGGALKVGPESAGADPGPACYGRGELPTVTDADLVLGRMPAHGLLGGAMSVSLERAHLAVGDVAKSMGMEVEQAADGIVQVVQAGMERAVRAISVERGLDPRDYVLVAFGGAAGMHACDLADGLGMRRVVVPREPGVLSAAGAVSAPTERNYVQTVRLRDPDSQVLTKRFHQLLDRSRRELRDEEGERRISLVQSVDVRYSGQSYEIEVPFSGSFRRDFHRLHDQLYGHSDPSHPLEVVNLRVSAAAPRPLPQRRSRAARAGSAVQHRMWSEGSWLDARCFERSAVPRSGIAGPVVIAEVSATTVVPRGWRCRAERSGDLVLERKARERARGQNS